MDSRLAKTVNLMIDYGADIGLAAPVWGAPEHECKDVPRGVYLKVTAAVRKLS